LVPEGSIRRSVGSSKRGVVKPAHQNRISNLVAFLPRATVQESIELSCPRVRLKRIDCHPWYTKVFRLL